MARASSPGWRASSPERAEALECGPAGAGRVHQSSQWPLFTDDNFRLPAGDVASDSRYLVGKTASDSLWNFGVSCIPSFGLGFDAQLRTLGVGKADMKKISDIYFSDECKQSFGRLLHTFPKHWPVIFQADQREPTDGGAFTGEQARRESLPVPLVRTDSAHYVLI